MIEDKVFISSVLLIFERFEWGGDLVFMFMIDFFMKKKKEIGYFVIGF